MSQPRSTTGTAVPDRDAAPSHPPAGPRRAALVTGGGRGIGRALSLRLARDGLDVAVAYRDDRAAAEEVADEVRALGGAALTVPVDVADPRRTRDAVAETIEALGRLDVLVNNAGIARDGLIVDLAPQDWRAVMDVNFGGVVNATQAVLGHFMSRGRGSIITISSVMAERGWVGQANYAASKGAVNAFTRSAAVELARFGVRVNAVMPGFVPTDLVAELVESSGREIRRQVPARRLGEVQEVAAAVSFLAAEESSYVTGACLAVDGGAAAQLGLGRPR